MALHGMLAPVTGPRPVVPTSARLAGWNLTALAAVLAAFNLCWTRTGARLLLPHAALSSAANEWLFTLTLFAGNLAAILALALLVLTLTHAEHRRRLFPPSLAVSLIFIAALFVLLTGRALLGPVGSRPLLYLKVAYGFLSSFIVIGAWRGHVFAALPRRHLVGVTLLVLPALFGAWASFLEHSTTVSATAVVLLDRAGERLWLVAAAVSPFSLAPRRREHPDWRWYALASAAGVVAAAGAFAFLVSRFDLVQTVAAHGLSLDVPAWTSGRNQLFVLLLAAATGGLAFTLLATLSLGGPWRLAGYGLTLIAAAGYAPTDPGLLAVSFVGSLALSLAVFALAAAVDAAGKQGPQQAQRSQEHVHPSQDQAPPAS